MGLLDDLTAGAVAGTRKLDQKTLPALFARLSSNAGLGGLSGLVERLRRGGLSHEVDSWLGSGRNLPVSAEQMGAALGDDAVARLAAAADLSEDDLLDMLARNLPQAVDEASPNGALSDDPLEIGGA